MIERFVPGAGGVENVAWQVAHGLRRTGVDVTVLARESAPDDALEPGARPTLIRLPVSRAWQPLRVLAFAHAVGRRLDRFEPPFDLVHGFSRTPRQDVYRAGGGSHAEYLDHAHGRLGRRWRRLSPRHRVLLEIERRVFADPRQHIQCASSLVADALVRRHGVARERIFLLPNAVDVEHFAPERHRAAARRLREAQSGAADPTGGDGATWLLPGSGWHRKGLDRLLSALALPGARRLRLWVAGRDEPRAWRRRARRLGIADRVRFIGERSDLERVYAAVDGMVLPTRYDAFANVTLEAAAAGLPIVTTTTNGAAEWLADACRIVDRPDDPEALAHALTALDDPEARRALGARARSRVAALDWPRHVARLREQYERILAAGAARADRTRA